MKTTAKTMLIITAYLIVCAGLAVAFNMFVKQSTIQRAIGNRPYLYAFEMDGELWFADYQEGVVLMDTDWKKLIKER